MPQDTQLIATTALFVLHWFLSYLDRRALARKHEQQEPITINLEIVVDPTMTHQPKVSAFQRKQSVTT